MGEATRGGGSRRSYLVFFLLAVVLNLWIFRHFLVTLATAASIAVLLSPLLERLAVELRGKRSLAAGLLTVLLAVFLLVPVASYGTILVKQAVDVYDQIRPMLEADALSDLWTRQLPERFPWLMRVQEASFNRRSPGSSAPSSTWGSSS
jgi:predicted PurR-regulated permease PerM